jgi:hypothetical protein
LKKVILIHPPIHKPCEPPAGVARLLGAIHAQGFGGTVLDANLECLAALCHQGGEGTDTWTRRALRNAPGHLESLRSWDLYRKASRYRRALADLGRLLENAGRPFQVRLTFANLQHRTLSPVRSGDLLQAAEKPQDSPFYAYLGQRLTRVIDSQEPAYIGFSLNFLSQALASFGMIGFVRSQYPNIRLILGGGLVTSWMRNPKWKNPFGGLIDHLVAGKGEEELLRLLGKSSSRAGGNHLPVYQSVSGEDYWAPGFILPYSAASGCYWSRCRFCPERAEGSPYEPIPPDRVIEELRALISEKKPILIHFLDNALSPALLQKVAGHPLGVPWYGFARITSHLAQLDFCHALKKSGCVMLQLGLESGDQKVLDRMEKGIDLSTASQVLSNLKQAGIAAYVYLLFGTPPEGPAEAQKTLDFVVRHHSCIDFLNLSVFNLPRYGPERLGLSTQEFYEGDLSLYTGFSHPHGWNRNLVREFLDKTFRRHAAIAPILRREPPVFTSNHAPLLVMAGAGHGSPSGNLSFRMGLAQRKEGKDHGAPEGMGDDLKE